MIKLFAFLVGFLMFVSSCGEKAVTSSGSLDFGEVNPGKKIEKTLTLDFNAAAKADKAAFLEFQFCDSLGAPVENITFLVGKRKVQGQKFRVTPADLDPNNKVRISIDFAQNAKEKEYAGYLMLVDASDELKQNISHPDTKTPINVHQKIGAFKATYKVPMPAWQEYMYYALAFLLVILLLWIGFIRDKVYPPMTGIINSPAGQIKLNGFKEFYIYGGAMPARANQGFISRLFTGKVGKYQTMAFDQPGFNSYILVSTQKTPKGIRNKLIPSDITLLTITKGQNILYDQCDYEIHHNGTNQKFDFIYFNKNHTLNLNI